MPARRALGRPKDPELELRRRAEILECATKLFASFGFANVQVQTIATQLGVGNGTIYRYFRTKEELFLSAVAKGLDELTRQLDEVIASPSDQPVLKIQRAVRTYLEFFHNRPEMAELFIQERAAFPQQHRSLYFANDDDARKCQHREFFKTLRKQGVIRKIPEERFFAVIGDLLYGTILTNLLSGRPADPKRQTEDVLDVIFNGILTVPPVSNRRTKK